MSDQSPFPPNTFRGAAAPPVPQNQRTDSGGLVEERFLTLIGLAAALMALALGPQWLVFVLVVTTGIHSVRSARADGRVTGADFVAVPLKVLGRVLKPDNIVTGFVMTAVWSVVGIVVAIVVPAVLAAGPWLLSRGGEGAVTAARLGVRSHFPELVCAELCFAVVRGLGASAATRRKDVLGFTKRFTEGAITLMVAGALLFSALLAMTGRRTGDLISSGDALSLVPGPFKSSVDRVRDAVVEGEIDAVTSCLSESTSGYWSAFYSEKNALGADDVVLMVPPTDDPPQTPGELQRALLSMHNQLSEWVDFIDIGAELGGPVQVRLDRSMLRHDVPVTDPNALLRAVAAGRELLGSPDESAADQSLRCSSRELL